MAKKRLTDLIREEAGRSPQSGETEASSEATASVEAIGDHPEALKAAVTELKTALQEALENEKVYDRAIADLEGKLKDEQQRAQELEESLQQGDRLAREGWQQAESELKAGLEEQENLIQKLQGDLKTAEKSYSKLEKERDKLKSDLAEQKELVKQLKADLKHAERLNRDLEQTKADALHLAEENEQLKHELDEVKDRSPGPSQGAIALIPRRPGPSDKVLPDPLAKNDINWLD
ncbi:hypothetical protein [Oxynema aestuarii]|jgi:chromosome segregation ATPase|uniref:Uncharacterized protein n=1 Tax=Oxynema aestuarii AP17 TaxID=2064643 RepID=A0A6H1TZP2_9CYAN|nr:hypothetical protein [Oxynema aestuarii]QIZ72051.1 hypothetical protein HCG48_16905 [Oxynema aestuarii AP17]RMH76167.1 MAG: hypothetical protein D6680_09340 [Cyanobacteria bacterium J007]